MWVKNIMMVIWNLLGAILMLLIVPIIGYYFEDIAFQLNPSMTDVVLELSGYIPEYLLMISLILAFSLSTNIEIPIIYTLLPNTKGAAVKYALLKPMLNKFQLIFVLFIIPFAVHYVFPKYGYASGTIWVLGLITIQIFVTFSIFLIKNKSTQNWKLIVGSVLLVVLISALHKMYGFDSKWIGIYVGTKLLDVEITLVATILIALFLVIDKNIAVLNTMLYGKEQKMVLNTASRFSTENILIKLPVKLIFFTRLIGVFDLKRPQFLISFLGFQLFMGILCFAPHFFGNTLNMIFYFQMFGSLIIVNILPLFFTSSSSYMDGINSNGWDLRRLLISYYRYIVVLYFVSLTLWLPWLYFYTDKLLLMIALSFFHAGFTACVYMLNTYFYSGRVAIYNKQKYKANGKLIGSSLLILFTTWAIIGFVYSVIGTVLGEVVALGILVAIGLLFVILHPIWLSEIVSHFQKNKHKKLAQYRAE